LKNTQAIKLDNLRWIVLDEADRYSNLELV
jgi:superfamily II DNA/RNA helicase